MLAELVRFDKSVTLIMNSSIQFLDFALTLDLRHAVGGFVAGKSGGLQLLDYDEATGGYQRPGHPNENIKPTLHAPLEDCVRLFDGVWLPLPLLRQNTPNHYADGPQTWARARLVKLEEGLRLADQHTHRLTLALDTTVFQNDEKQRYLAPSMADVNSAATFGLAHAAEHAHWFHTLPWVDEWLRESFHDTATPVLGLTPDDRNQAIRQYVHHAHYLNLIHLIGQTAHIPQIRLVSNTRNSEYPALDVDMVLDIGNSRSFGILVEDHRQSARHGLDHRYELALRDLSQCHQVYTEPFESRVELALPMFGKEHCATKSGRSGAFLWPTIGRVGPEAARLAGGRRGTEGATGISSPKRYLWDTDRFRNGWRFNSAYVRGDKEPMAVAAPISTLIDETGRALFELNADAREPVFHPFYSRSAMMTFMLAEVFTQALGQINSVGQRLRMPDAHLPRHLRSIILTVPPSMPKQERDIFTSRIREAVGIVWKALGWHPPDAAVDGDDAQTAWPPLPQINVSWDEVTCCQVVYLFNETQNIYGGRTGDFFAQTMRSKTADQPHRLTIATVDIGGGTTDLVINDYVFDGAKHVGDAYIEPELRFHDGFRIAGDDILLQVIRIVLIPAFEKALTDAGITNPKLALAGLMGAQTLDVRDSVLRQQLVVQLIHPAGLALLKQYEQYDPFLGCDRRSITLGDLARDGGGGDLSSKVCDFIQRMISGQGLAFDALSIAVIVDLADLHQQFLSHHFEIRRAIGPLCEVINQYHCDILLLTGRPSRLPGIQFLFRALLPLPPDRIISLHQYHTGSWYPFNRQGAIDDPKTTAAVGAMLCLLGGKGRLANFYLRANVFSLRSTIRHLGVMDHNLMIKQSIYQDMDLNDPEYQLPDTAFPVLGDAHIGYRQLAVTRWSASPLYVFDIDPQVRDRMYARGGRLNVWLRRCPGADAEYLCVDRAEMISTDGDRHPVNRDAVRLKLNTLAAIGLSCDSYWLDSGTIIIN